MKNGCELLQLFFFFVLLKKLTKQSNTVISIDIRFYIKTRYLLGYATKNNRRKATFNR